jgi:hypothetical protein
MRCHTATRREWKTTRMSDAKRDTTTSPELLQAAREAGVVCLDAYQKIVEKGKEPADKEVQDYEPLLASLCDALISGWSPISRCWPKLRIDDATTTCRDPLEIDWKTITPPEIWLLARNVFWNVAWDTRYRGPACVAWLKRQQWFVPRLPNGPEVCQLCWASDDIAWEHIRRIVAQCSLPDSWDSAAGLLRETPAGASEDWLDLPDVLRKVGGPSLHVIPPEHLPCASGPLERLLREANDLVSHYSEYKQGGPFLLACSKL